MRPFFPVSCILLCLLARAHSAAFVAPERSLSTSRQFLVYGVDVRLRGVICDLAEKTKRDVLQLLRQPDEWTTPIVIDAQYPQANLPERPGAALSFAQTGFGLKLQLALTIAPDIALRDVRRELLRAVLLDLIYRHETNLPAESAYVPPPDWLVEGIPAEQSGDLAAAVFARKPLSLAEFLEQRFDLLDHSGRALYRAYSCLLVKMLTERPGGRERMARFIADLHAGGNDRMADLLLHFPELISAGAAEKVWTLNLAQLAVAQPAQSLNVRETEEKLDGLLGAKGFDFASAGQNNRGELPALLRQVSAKAKLARCGLELEILAGRANLIYQPVISEYAQIALYLARGKTKGVRDRLARVREQRRSAAKRIQEMADYLNWFEATQSVEPSGVFTDYMKAATAQPERRRRDPISIYLDVLEVQFQD